MANLSLLSFEDQTRIALCLSRQPSAVPPPPAATTEELLPGWESAVDPSSRNTYYFNRSTGKTTWDLSETKDLQPVPSSADAPPGGSKRPADGTPADEPSQKRPRAPVSRGSPETTSDFVAIIVGAGPVGLLTALELKERCPELQVIVYEKRDEYVREHALRLEARSFEGCTDYLQRSGLISSWTPDVPTNKLQEDLRREAESKGVIVRGSLEIKDLAQVGDANIIIGCDGARSKVREQICEEGKQYKVDELIQRCIQIKFDLVGDLCQFKENLLHKDFAFETQVNTTRDGFTPVACFIPVSEELYDRAKDCVAGVPCQVEALNKVDPGLRKECEEYLQNFCEIKKDSLSGKPLVKISRVILNATSSATFAKLRKEVPVLIVGDAAYGVPFNRALNEGIKCSISLVSLVADWMRFPEDWRAKKLVDNYNVMMRRESDRAVKEAKETAKTKRILR